MTKEEAIKYFERHLDLYCVDGISREAEEMAIQALSQEPPDTVSRGVFEQVMWERDIAIEQLHELGYEWGQKIEPCDEKKDCSTCKYEECSSNYQPCRDCGTLLESYTNWEPKERELPCIYDLKNRYCPRLNEHGMLKYPLQEPCDEAEQIDYHDDFETALKKMQDYEERKKQKSEPCDDAISRDAALEKMADYVASGYADSAEDFEEYSKIICQLPSVTQKSGKWDRLYSWLNDMRLSIAPDETVTDIDERHCRESQTDILDEIMEWMIKAEVEPQESEDKE